MSKPRNPNLPQHEYNQGHYGELPLSALPAPTLPGHTFTSVSGTDWSVGYPIDVRDQGVSEGGAYALDFQGEAISVTNASGVAQVILNASAGSGGDEIIFGNNQNFDTGLGDWDAPAGGSISLTGAFGIFKDGASHFGNALTFASTASLQYARLPIDFSFKQGRRYWAGVQIQAPSGSPFDVVLQLGTPTDNTALTHTITSIGTNRDIHWQMIETQWVPDADYTAADLPQLRIYVNSGSHEFRVGYAKVGTGPVQHFRGRDPNAGTHLVHNTWGVASRYYKGNSATFNISDTESGQYLEAMVNKKFAGMQASAFTDGFLYLAAEHTPGHMSDLGIEIDVGEDFLGLIITESGSDRMQIYPYTDGYDIDFIDQPNGKWNIVSSDGSGRAPLSNLLDASINIVFDGGGSAITTGVKADIVVDFDCEIQSATLLADQTGSIVVDIWKETYANFPPTVADTITASAKPTLSSAMKSQDTTLTGWTKTVAAGDILRFNVDSAATVTRVTIDLKVRRT